MVKNYWILPSILGISLVSTSMATAQQLSPTFNSNQRVLEFTTNTQVRPRADLLSEPNRLVISLPGTSLRDGTYRQTLSGGFQELRVGYDITTNTTRLVIQLADGFALDPQEVLIQGRGGGKWRAQLPVPQSVSSFRSGIPVGSVPVFDANGQVLTTVPIATNPTVSTPSPAVVDYISLNQNGQGILLQANQRLEYTGTWDRSTNGYQINIPNVRLASNYLVPASSQNQISVIPVGNGIQITGRGFDPGQFGTVQQYYQNQWITLRPNTVNIAIPSPTNPNPPMIGNRTGGNDIPGEPLPTPIPTPSPTTGSSSRRVVVMVDPGHGGKDPGAIGINGLREVDVIFPISLKVKEIVESRRPNVQVVLTRNADYFVGLDERVVMSRQAGADLFVSIHANAIDGRPDVNGLETYHYGTGESLAETVHASILDYFNNQRGISLNNRRVRKARFLVIRKSSVPAILVETGYLTSPDESPKLADPTYRNHMAEGIARGIIRYIDEKL